MRRTLFALLFCALLCGASAGASAQQPPPVVGGYSAASKADPGVLAAARFAAKETGRRRKERVRLVSVESAETQVVAGVNFRLCLRVKAGKSVRDLRAVVYRNLKRQLSLTESSFAACDG